MSGLLDEDQLAWEVAHHASVSEKMAAGCDGSVIDLELTLEPPVPRASPTGWTAWMADKLEPAWREMKNTKMTQTQVAKANVASATDALPDGTTTPDCRTNAPLEVPATRVLPRELAAAFDAGQTVHAQASGDGGVDVTIDPQYFAESFDLAVKTMEVERLLKQVDSMEERHKAELSSLKESAQEARAQAQRDADEIAEKAAFIDVVTAEKDALAAEKKANVQVRGDAQIELAVQRKYIMYLRRNKGMDPCDKPVPLTMGRNYVNDSNRVRELGARMPTATQSKWWVPPGMLVQPFAQWL